MTVSELVKRAKAYLDTRQAQELDHTDPALDFARTEAHNALTMQMDIVGVGYKDREDAARIAAVLMDPDLVAAARRYVTAYTAWSLSHPPYSNIRDAWYAFDRALDERGIVTGDRLGLARGLAGE